uniref:GTP_EFTU_D2 domain-containing protein n=1 Tax=Rhabditophanes sp. KR3021 TaxID=114890 RepID=A0AC35TI97_9BILA
MGLESKLKRVIDLVTSESFYYEENDGLAMRRDQMPAQYKARDLRQEMIEDLANCDESIENKFLNDINPSIDEINAAIRANNKGAQRMIENVIKYLPNAGEVTNKAKIKKADGEEDKLVLNSMRSVKKDKRNPFVELALKLEAGKDEPLMYLRVYEGEISRGDTIYATRDGRKVRVERLVRMHGNRMEDIGTTYAGDICVIYEMDC